MAGAGRGRGQKADMSDRRRKPSKGRRSHRRAEAYAEKMTSLGKFKKDEPDTAGLARFLKGAAAVVTMDIRR
jgi:hypothetical protein